ncbi:MAG: SDR family NAD(P)-dependent oxidoreductase, partial [Candidatus Izemoplasmatales bacterium]
MKYPDELMFLKNAKLPQKKSEVSMKNQLVVISGGTSGVGLSAARELAKFGANLVLVARNLEKASKVKEEIEQQFHVQVDLVFADFTKLDTVRQAAKTISEKYPHIDVLINSAGIHNTKKRYTEDGFEEVFCVNHLSTFLFTYLLVPTLIQSAPSKILQVNSEGHRFNGLCVDDLNWRKRWTYTGLRSYGASKIAQLMTVWNLAKLLEPKGVTINAMHPGAVKSNIGNNNGPLYRFYLHKILWHSLKDPHISGEAIHYLVSSEEMEGKTGKFYHLTIQENVAKHAINPKKERIVWQKSKEMAG